MGASRRNEVGGGRIGAIIGLLVVVGAAYTMFKWIPPRTQNAEFNEAVERLALRHVVNEINEEQLVKGVVDWATKEGIPLTEDDVSVDQLGDKVRVRAHYVLNVPIVGGKIWKQAYDLDVEVARL